MEFIQWTPSRLAIGCVITPESPITSLDYHKNGQYLVLATKESALHLIDSITGVEKKKILMKTHGIGLVKFTHHESCVLVTSERNTHAIRYVSIIDNKYLRFFKAHNARVVSISMSPVNDHFLSASVDGMIYLWDLASPKQVAMLRLPEPCLNLKVSFDSTGTIFGVLTNGSDPERPKRYLKLFAAELSPNSSENAPFLDLVPSDASIRAAISKVYPPVSTSQMEKYLKATWTDFIFSPDGANVFVNTNSDMLLILDSYSAEKEPLVICSRKNAAELPHLGFAYSADGKFLLAANEDKEIIVYDARNGATVTILRSLYPYLCF